MAEPTEYFLTTDSEPDRTPIGDGTELGLSLGSEAKEEQRSMDRAILSGLFWTALGKWSTQALTWISTLIVARILTPEDFGILALALVFLGLVYLVNEFGLSAAVIHNHALSPRLLSSLASVSVLIGTVFAGITIALSGIVAGFFDEPAIRPVIMVLSGTLILSGMQVVPRGLLTRELEFRTLAIVDGLQALSAAAVTLLLALAGLGYWSLVLGNVVAKLVATGLVLWARPHPWGPLVTPQKIMPELKFGGHMALANVGWYIYGNADSVVIGRILGTAPLGAYGIAANLASAPIAQVTALLSRVTAGVFSGVQDNARAVKRYLIGLTQFQAFLTFPAAAGMALVAPEFVRTVLGDHWAMAIVPLQVLAICAMVRCLGPVVVQALVFTGHPELNSRITFVGALSLPLLFLAGARWGVDGVAFGWLLGYGGVVFPTVLYFMRSRLGIGISVFVASLVPPLFSTVVMVVAVVAVDSILPANETGMIRLAAKVGTGVIIYAAVVFGVYRERIASLRALIQSARS